MIALLLAVSLLDASPPPVREKTSIGALLFVYGLPAAADNMVTEAGLARGGLREANPLALKSWEGRAAVKVGIVGALVVLDRWLEGKSPKAAKIMRVVYAGAWTAAACWNAHMLMKARR